MKTREILEAIEQMKVQCDLKMTNYESVSARSVLYELGYDNQQTTTILQNIADGGFNYCLDHSIMAYSRGTGKGEYPSQEVCYWGPDQLKSRLDSLHW